MDKKTFISTVSQKSYHANERVTAHGIGEGLLNFIQKQHPSFKDNGDSISIQELNVFRQQYIALKLKEESGELNHLQEEVLKAMANERILSADDGGEISLTFGQRIADKVADFGGSWTFILSFMGFLVLWILVNVFVLVAKPFDPFPFILLNLILSCIAAMQAPIIMMSQNRQEEKDRERAKRDYKVNLKSELEIRMLHEKVDHLIMHQQQELLEIQNIQMEMLNDILSNLKQKKN